MCDNLWGEPEPAYYIYLTKIDAKPRMERGHVISTHEWTVDVCEERWKKLKEKSRRKKSGKKLRSLKEFSTETSKIEP